MPECIDPETGDLLHAFELQMLSEEDTERFEIHLFECEHCFRKAKRFEKEASIIRTHQQLRHMVKETLDRETPGTEELPGGVSEPGRTTLWRHLWPEGHLLGKPALLYLIFLAMIYPAYRGLTVPGKESIRPLQVVNFYTDRATAHDTFRISLGADGLLEFRFSDPVADSYRLVIESGDGETEFQVDRFTEFDTTALGDGIGRLIFPLARMEPGTYRLSISDPRPGSRFRRQEYSFTIEK